MEKKLLQLEYLIGAVSLRSLWRQISTPAGLETWLAERVTNNIGKLEYTFHWSKGNEEIADIVECVENSSITFHWQHEESKDYYLKFSIQSEELTRAFTLQVSDFTTEEDQDNTKLFWDMVIVELKKSLGAEL